MIEVRYNTQDFTTKINNVVEYTEGFAQGIKQNKKNFNNELGKIAVEMLKKYIDSRASAEKDSLHHVYEWGMVGSPGGRLFQLDSKASSSGIVIFGDFLPSKSVSDSSDEPFVDKANIMENAIMIEIFPRNNVLAFEADGETVFTADTVYVANPGGDGVAGSFGKVVEDFFDFHFTAQVFMQSGLYQKLSSASEYAQFFSAGANGGGRSAGIQAGKKYLTVKGVEFS
jgi:hypothetical protein